MFSKILLISKAYFLEKKVELENFLSSWGCGDIFTFGIGINYNRAIYVCFFEAYKIIIVVGDLVTLGLGT